jgi:hypothetical protein
MKGMTYKQRSDYIVFCFETQSSNKLETEIAKKRIEYLKKICYSITGIQSNGTPVYKFLDHVHWENGYENSVKIHVKLLTECKNW